jgi:hypothetical protein
MTNVSSAGNRTTGFFGFFDVLGYSRMMEKNSLDNIIEIYNSTILRLNKIAEFFANKPLEYNFAVHSLAFSDTFILYQDANEKFTSISTKHFISTSSCLLRLAFDRGIPLRGAISYGAYFISENPICLLGKPLVEANESQKKQEWSGAILCKSAQEVIRNMLDLSGFRLIEYDVPFGSKTKKCYALRWDDSDIENYIMLGLGAYDKGLDLENENQIRNTVREKFSSHKKPIDQNVERKIENTTKFIIKQNEELAY